MLHTELKDKLYKDVKESKTSLIKEINKRRVSSTNYLQLKFKDKESRDLFNVDLDYCLGEERYGWSVQYYGTR